MKATEPYFPVVLFIMMYKVVLTFESMDEILKVAQLDFSGRHPPNVEWLILHRENLDELATSSSY